MYLSYLQLLQYHDGKQQSNQKSMVSVLGSDNEFLSRKMSLIIELVKELKKLGLRFNKAISRKIILKDAALELHNPCGQYASSATHQDGRAFLVFTTCWDPEMPIAMGQITWCGVKAYKCICLPCPNMGSEKANFNKQWISPQGGPCSLEIKKII